MAWAAATLPLRRQRRRQLLHLLRSRNLQAEAACFPRRRLKRCWLAVVLRQALHQLLLLNLRVVEAACFPRRRLKKCWLAVVLRQALHRLQSHRLLLLRRQLPRPRLQLPPRLLKRRRLLLSQWRCQ